MKDKRKKGIISTSITISTLAILAALQIFQVTVGFVWNKVLNKFWGGKP